jgi:hypothetical protein
MTFLELQTEVAANIIDLPTVVSARVPTLITRAVTALQNRHNFKVMDTEVSFTTTLATRSIGSVPSAFKEWRLAPAFVDDDTGQWNRMVMAPDIRSIRESGITELDDGYPVFLLQSDSSSDAGAYTLSVYPLPDGESDYSDGEYRIKVPYRKYLTTLSSDSDTNWFTVNASEYLINYATSLGFAADWDEQRMGVWAQLAENKFREIVMKDKKERLAGVDTLVPHYLGVNASRTRI